MIKADEQENPGLEKEFYEELENEKSRGTRLLKLSTPFINVFFGFIFATIMGSGFPLLGWIFMEQIFVLFSYG